MLETEEQSIFDTGIIYTLYGKNILEFKYERQNIKTFGRQYKSTHIPDIRVRRFLKEEKYRQ